MKKFKMMWSKSSGVIYPLILGLIIFILWQTTALNKMLDVSGQILPTPSHIVKIVKDNFSDMRPDIGTTLQVIIVGLITGSLLGYLLAVIAALFPNIGKGGITLVTAFNAIPIIAMTPVFMNLTKLDMAATSAERSLTAKIMVTTVVSMSSMSITAFRGLVELRPFSKDLLDSYACNKMVTLWKLRMPNSIPYVLTALKIGIPTAVITALVSEYFTESAIGVGYKIKSNIQNSQYAVGWAYILVACIIGITLYALLSIISGIILRHRKS